MYRRPIITLLIVALSIAGYLFFHHTDNTEDVLLVAPVKKEKPVKRHPVMWDLKSEGSSEDEDQSEPAVVREELGDNDEGDSSVDHGEAMDDDEVEALKAEEIEGYSPTLFRETTKLLTVEMGRAPSHDEVIKYLDMANEQIQAANQEMAENIGQMKKLYEEGNFEAMEKLQNEIYRKHVTIALPMVEEQPSEGISKEELEKFSQEQFKKYVEEMDRLQKSR